MADTSRSIDILLNARDNARPGIDSTTNALSKLNETLHASQSSLRSFNSVMELALGFHIGRFFFEKIHEGIGEMVTGFKEASEAGKGFADSMGEGLQKALGMKTATAEIAENMKKSQDIGKAMLAAGEAAQHVLHPAPAQTGSAELAQLRANVKAAQDAAAPGRAKIDELTADMLRLEGLMRGTVLGKIVGAFGITTKQVQAGDVSGIREIEEQYGQLFTNVETARKQLADYSAKFANVDARKKLQADEAKKMGDNLFGLTGNDTLAAYFHRIETLAAGTLGGALGAPLANAGGITSFLYRAITGGAKAQTFKEEMDAILRNGPKSTDVHPGLVAENQRMLTRGPGDIGQKQLEVQNRMAKGIDDTNRKLDDLRKKFGPIGVVDKL